MTPHDDQHPIDPNDPALAPFHQPTFEAAEYRGYGRYAFRFAPQLVDGPEPSYPTGYHRLPAALCDFVFDEYRTARIVWARAQARKAGLPLLRQADPLWKNFVRARKTLEADWRQMWDTDDPQWRKQIMRLLDAREEALRTAREFDYVAARLAELQWQHIQNVGADNEIRLNEVAQEEGLAVGEAGPLGMPEDYRTSFYSTPTVREVEEQIAEQDERLRRVEELAPNRAAGESGAG